MNALQVVALILTTLVVLALGRLLLGLFAGWCAERMGLCMLCHKRRAEYWFNEGQQDGFPACVVCLNHKLGITQRLKWTDSGRLTPYPGGKE